MGSNRGPTIVIYIVLECLAWCLYNARMEKTDNVLVLGLPKPKARRRPSTRRVKDPDEVTVTLKLSFDRDDLAELKSVARSHGMSLAKWTEAVLWDQI